MKLKIKEKAECRELRKQGYSLNFIAQKIKVSKSSVSLWVRDIELTNEQIEIIEYKRKASASNSETFRKRRREYQEIGREKAKKSDSLYAFGCALFWGEGSKKKNNVIITNSDPLMLSFFVKFLKKYFNVSSSDFSISIQYYLNNGLSLNEIEQYWCNILNLSKESLKEHTLKSKYYGGKKVKHPYGICSVRICNTSIAMQIYGSIKEYMGDISKDKWLW